MSHSIPFYSKKPEAELFHYEGKAVKISFRLLELGDIVKGKFHLYNTHQRNHLTTDQQIEIVYDWLKIELDITEDFDKELLAVLERHKSEWAV